MKLDIQKFAIVHSSVSFIEPSLSDYQIINNKSTLYIDLRLVGSGAYTIINKVGNSRITKTINITGGAITTRFEWNILHDNDGNKTIGYEFYVGSETTSNRLLYGTKQLQKIPRESEITSITSGTTPYAPVLKFTPQKNDFVYKINYKYNNYYTTTSTIQATDLQEITFNGITIDDNYFLHVAGNDTSYAIFTARLLTFLNDETTLVGSTEKTFEVTLNENIKPSVDIGNPTENDATMEQLNWGIFVQNHSKLSVSAVGYQALSSPIKEIDFEVDGKNYSSSSPIGPFYMIDTSTITSSGNLEIKATAIDSRDREGESTLASYIYPYQNPQLINAQVKRVNANNEEDEETGQYLSYSFNYEISPCNNNNAKRFNIKYREKGSSGSYTNIYTNTTDYSKELNNQRLSSPTFDTSKQYEIVFELTDTFNTTPITITKILNSGFDLLNFNSSGKAMAIGKVSEASSNEELLEVALPTTFLNETNFNSETTLNDVNINGIVKDELVVENIRSKNMFDKTTIVAGDITGINSTIRLSSRQAIWLEAGTYTLSCNITSPFRYGIQIQSVGVPPLSSYPTYILDSGWKTSSQKTYTFTINTSGWANLMLSKENNATLTVSEALGFNYQLERNSSATTYYPYQNFEEIKSVKIPQNDFIEQLNSGITIMHYNIFKLSNTISGTIVVKTTNVIGNTNVELFNIKEGYKPSTYYYTFCGLGTDDWKVQRIGYFYLGSNGNAIVVDQNNSGVCKYAIINFNYQI